jgi:hypothetical protein
VPKPYLDEFTNTTAQLIYKPEYEFVFISTRAK